MSTSPAMASKIELWALDQLTPYAHNARTHSDNQIARIAASMSGRPTPCWNLA